MQQSIISYTKSLDGFYMSSSKAKVFALSCLITFGLGFLTATTLVNSKSIEIDSVTTITSSSNNSSRKEGYKITAKVTAYCPCSLCCGKFADGKTSRGRDAWRTRGVAVDPKVIPYGSQVTIPGYGTFVADDTGSAMKKGGVRIDLRFPTHAAALEFGVKEMDINVR